MPSVKAALVPDLKRWKAKPAHPICKKTHSVKFAFIDWCWKQILFFVLAVLDFGPGQLTSRRFIIWLSWNAGFYKPFILKVCPSIFRIISHAIMPGKKWSSSFTFVNKSIIKWGMLLTQYTTFLLKLFFHGSECKTVSHFVNYLDLNLMRMWLNHEAVFSLMS